MEKKPETANRASAPDHERTVLLLPDLAEEELEQESRLLAMACRSALGPCRDAELRPDPAIQAYLRDVVRARRPAGPVPGVRPFRMPVSQAVLGLAATLFISFVPDRLIPTATHLPLDLLVNCQVAPAPVDAYAGLDDMRAIGNQQWRASQSEDELSPRGLVPSAPPADST